MNSLAHVCLTTCTVIHISDSRVSFCPVTTMISKTSKTESKDIAEKDQSGHGCLYSPQHLYLGK